MNQQPQEPDEVLTRLLEGDESALGELFSRHRERLGRMIVFRLDRRISGRVDVDDILQEAFLNAAQRLTHYQQDFSQSFFIWLRLIVLQTLVDVHRRHLGAEMRDAGREVSINVPSYPQSTSVSLARRLAGNLTSPSQAAMRGEMAKQIEQAVASMDPIDQEVLALRHFEDLSNSEVAELLGIGQAAASNRYVRALARLKDILVQIPGFPDS